MEQIRKQPTILTIANVQVVGFHSWPEAPDPVKYLSNQHRHVFKISVGVHSSHADRAYEFHMMQREVADVLFRLYPTPEFCSTETDFGRRSCEMIAADLHAELPFSQDIAFIEVSEDGENSARLEWAR